MSNRINNELRRVMSALSDSAPEWPHVEEEARHFNGRRAMLAFAAATMLLLSATVAVAALLPSGDSAVGVCEPPPGWGFPSSDCAPYEIDRQVAAIEQFGTPEERAAISDGEVSREELDAAAMRWQSCVIEGGIDSFRVQEEPTEIGIRYSGGWKDADGLTDDEEIQIVEQCADLHHTRLSLIWEAQRFRPPNPTE